MKRGKIFLNGQVLFVCTVLLCFVCLFACKSEVDEPPEAAAPTLVSVSDDVFGVLHGTYSVSVSATVPDRGTLSYQWFVAESKLASGNPVDDSTESICVPLTEEAGVSYYYCVITNTLGPRRKSVTSPRICVTISPAVNVSKPTILSQPENITAEYGENFVLKVVAYSPDEGNISYQWYHSRQEGLEAVAVEGAVAAEYSGIVSSDTEGVYFCEVQNEIEDNGDGGAKTVSVKTNLAVISHNMIHANVPVILSQPKNITTVIPNMAEFMVHAYVSDGGTLSYQWYDAETDEVLDGEIFESLALKAWSVGKKGYYCAVTNTISDNRDGGSKQRTIKSDVCYFDVELQNAEIPTLSSFSECKIYVVSKESINLSVEAVSTDGIITYQWYSTTDGTSENGTKVMGANESTYTITNESDMGKFYFYCVATNNIHDNKDGGVKSASVTSGTYTVLHSGLPLLSITTVDAEEPTCDYIGSPTGWGAGIANATKVPSRMVMTKNNETLYDSGEYVKKESGLTIKIRGNTSAYVAKKPYKLKLQAKADLLSHTRAASDTVSHADKNWILLADATSLNTKIGLKVADLLGFAWTPAYEYVDVVMNGQYRGVYLLIESIERADYRINVKKNGFIIERDTYWFTEDVYFDADADPYNSIVKYTFKYPDPDDEIAVDDENFNYIKDYVNKAYDSLFTELYETYLDIDSFARWCLVHDILGTEDSAGSNMYISKYDKTDETKLKMETPWDFDSIYLPPTQKTHEFSVIHDARIFYFPFLFENENKAFLLKYKECWNEVKNMVWNNLKCHLDEFASEYEEGLNTSRQVDAKLYSAGYHTVSENISTAESWFESQILWLDSAINALQ